jgi:hypothetical protein
VKTLSIRQVLLADAAITGATALLMLAGATLLDDLLDLPAALLAGTGAVLVPYVGYLTWLATRDDAPRPGVLAVIGLNVAWAIGCVALLVSGQVEPSALGTGFVVIQAVAVLVFADLQAIALRGPRPAREERSLRFEV